MLVFDGLARAEGVHYPFNIASGVIDIAYNSGGNLCSLTVFNSGRVEITFPRAVTIEPHASNNFTFTLQGKEES